MKNLFFSGACWEDAFCSFSKLVQDQWVGHKFKVHEHLNCMLYRSMLQCSFFFKPIINVNGVMITLWCWIRITAINEWNHENRLIFPPAPQSSLFPFQQIIFLLHFDLLIPLKPIYFHFSLFFVISTITSIDFFTRSNLNDIYSLNGRLKKLSSEEMVAIMDLINISK